MHCNHKWVDGGDFKGNRCAECFEPTSNVLSLVFDGIEEADRFKAWMCDGGVE